MPANQTHYEVLGVPRTARNTDINRAHQNLLRASRRDDVAPDAKRDARIREAYATLSDPDLRERYDQSLVVKRAKGGGRILGAAIVGTLVVTAAVVLYLNRASAVAPVGRPLQELSAEAARSVGRVRSIDVSGKTTDTGLAFAIDENVMAAACAGLAPGAQIVVRLPARDAPARLTEADGASGLCKLAIDGGASWPLPLSGAGARVGETVYAAHADASGTVSLVEGTVRSVREAPQGRVIEATMALAQRGAPLIDASGRVIGVAASTDPDGTLRHVALPGSWTQAKSAPARPPPRDVEPVPDAATRTAPGGGPEAASPPQRAIDLPPQRKEQLRKALRPDPNLPPDL